MLTSKSVSPDKSFRDRAILILALFVCAVCSIILFEHKVGFFLDEYYSLMRANALFSQGLIPSALSYVPASTYFQDYLAVHPGHEFDYMNAWLNESINVHPPLYYFLVHTLCSLVPGKIAEWSLMVINMIFTLLTLIVGYKLVKLFTDSSLVLASALLAFSLSAGILDLVAFLRMYCMAMLWCTLFCYLLCARMRNTKPSRCFYAQLALTVFAGAMTHYYCIIYFVFACLCFFTWLTVRKQFRQLGHSALAIVGAGIASVVFFPHMLKHIFFGYRGVESWSNLANHSDFFSRLDGYATRINAELFGSLAFYLTALLAIFVIAAFVRHAKSSNLSMSELPDHNRAWEMVTLLVPVVLYFFVVVKISSYWHTNRYLYPIYPLIIWSFAISLWNLSRIAAPRKAAIATSCILLALLTGSGLLHASWNNLHFDQAEAISSATERANLDCVVIVGMNTSWPLTGILECKPEASQYASLTFIDSQNLSNLQSFSDRDKLMLFIDSAVDSQTVADLATTYNLPNTVERIYAYTCFTSYLLT